MSETPNYPEPSALETGMTVEIAQSADAEPIVGEVGAVLGEAEPRGARVKLKSGAVGRVRAITPA